MEVVRLTSDSWETLKEIRLRALSEAPDAFGPTYEREVAFSDDEWRKRVSEMAWFAAIEGGVSVGVAAGAADEGVRKLLGMWVSPEHRGQGIADLLVKAVADWAHTDGAGELRLFVAEGNDRARRFYERLSFRSTGTEAAFRGRSDRSKYELAMPLPPIKDFGPAINDDRADVKAIS